MSDPFEDNLTRWREWTEAPWGRIRFAVVEETLRRQAAELGEGLRILDVGGGDGGDAIPLARAGHHVTIVDPAPSWLAEARRRAKEADVAERIETVEASLDDLAGHEGFDLVLCHSVLHYRPADAQDIRRLAQALRAGGRLSVMAPNPVGRTLRQLTTNGPRAARKELAAETMHAVTFDHGARKIAAEDMTTELAAAGLTTIAHYGIRIANDLLTDDEAKLDPAYFADLLALELDLCDREPYRRIGAMWQLVAEK